jgi:hypothetical protein
MVMYTASTCINPTAYLVNVGVWWSPDYGKDFPGVKTFEQFVASNRKIEEKAAEVGGFE